MAVIRVNKTKNYTVMSNFHLKDKRLSLKAKGLLSIMLSLSDEWSYSVAGLVAICIENETAINSTLKELKNCGYLVVTKKMPNETESGRIEYEYNIYEQPLEIQQTEKQDIVKQGVENLGVENQGAENQGQLNTKVVNTEKLNTDDKLPKIDYLRVTTMYNTICKSYPHLKSLSDARKKAIKARLNTYTYEDFKTLFEKAEASDFLKGKNDRNWSANFDWLTKDANMAKVLDGNYDNKGRKEAVPSWMKNVKDMNNFPSRGYDMDYIEQALLNADSKEPPKTAGEDENIRLKALALQKRLMS